MSKIETQLEINGVTYSGKDLDLICLGMSLKEDRIIKLVERFGFDDELGFSFEQAKEDLLTLIKGEK
jgi:hypothetical protein